MCWCRGGCRCLGVDVAGGGGGVSADQPVRAYREGFRYLFDVLGRWFRTAGLPMTAGCSGDAESLGQVGLRQLS